MTDSRPSFSVVTPSLNQGRFIAEAIESVLAQANAAHRIQHIIVEGGSVDETHDVLARYPHLIIRRDPGGGQSQAVNIGLEAVSGEVIGWLNADDRYVPGAFESVCDALGEHPDAGAVYGNAQTINEAGEVIGEIRSAPFDLNRMLNGVNAIPQPAVFVRATLLEQIGPLDESLHYVMDYELWLRAARVSRLVWIDATWAQFRRHSSSKTVSREPWFWPEMRAVARAYGGPYFSEAWRLRTLNRTFPKTLLRSLGRRFLS